MRKPALKWWKRPVVYGGVGLGLLYGAGKAAEVLEHKTPNPVRPAVTYVAKSSRKIKAQTKVYVQNAVQKYGWEVFKRALGAAVAAGTAASLLGARRKVIKRSGRGGENAQHTLHQSSHSGIGGRTRDAIVASSAIGGALVPGAALTAGALRAVYGLYQGMSPRQQAAVATKLKEAAAKTAKKKVKSP